MLDDLSLQSIKFSDEIIEQIKEMEAGTKQQQFNADFLIMTETLDGLFKNLLDSFTEQPIAGKIDAGNIIPMAKKMGG